MFCKTEQTVVDCFPCGQTVFPCLTGWLLTWICCKVEQTLSRWSVYARLSWVIRSDAVIAAVGQSSQLCCQIDAVIFLVSGSRGLHCTSISSFVSETFSTSCFKNPFLYFSRPLKWVTNSFKISFSFRCSISSSLLVHSGQHFSFQRWTTETMRKHFHGDAEDSRRCYSVQLCCFLQSQMSLEL